MPVLIKGKMNIKTYSELKLLPTFEERFQYLKLDGQIGDLTFGFQRWINQELYHSLEWRKFRDEVIIRDNGCDLGVSGYDIFGSVLIHHINPITADDILNNNPCVFDLNNVICTTQRTHNAIHYGNQKMIDDYSICRYLNDTSPWLKTD